MENLPNEIASNGLAITNIEELQRVAKIFVASGFFSDTRDIAQACVKIMAGSDTRDIAQACVKILAGSELGFTPMQSMTGVYILKGKVAFSAALMASAITRKGLKYRVKEHTDDICSIEYFDTQNESMGVSTFTSADAKTAGLGGDNWKKYPRNMLFARAMSNGARWYCAEAFGGTPVYTPDELEAPKPKSSPYYIKNIIEKEDEKTLPTMPEMPDAPEAGEQKKKLKEQLSKLKKESKKAPEEVNVPGMEG